MASVQIDGDILHIELGGWDKLWAFHGSFSVPLQNVAGASTDKPPAYFDSLRLLGTGLGPLKRAGTFLYHGETVFFDFGHEHSILVIDLPPGASTYRHLFVAIDQPDTPEEAAARINAALASLPPAA